MAAAKTAGARKSTRRPPLPAITVAKLEETGRLLERVVSENQTLFIERGQAYRENHRAGSSRPLSPLEAAQIAAVIAEDDRLKSAEEVQESTLRAYDEPDAREILFHSGIGAAPAFIAAVRDVVALVEMPASDFEDACEDGTLLEQIETRSLELRKLELADASARARAAFAHYAASAGFDPGEAWRLPVQAIWQALGDAMSHLVDALQSSQLIDSAASTAGDDATSSTT